MPLPLILRSTQWLTLLGFVLPSSVGAAILIATKSAIRPYLTAVLQPGTRVYTDKYDSYNRQESRSSPE